MKRVVTNNDQNGESFIVSHSITNIEIPLPDFDKGFKFYNLIMA